MKQIKNPVKTKRLKYIFFLMFLMGISRVKNKSNAAIGCIIWGGNPKNLKQNKLIGSDKPSTRK